MASDLRMVLIILGALVLGGLFLHGLWTVRKNSSKTQHRYHPEENTKDDTAEGFAMYIIQLYDDIELWTTLQKNSEESSILVLLIQHFM